LFFDAHTNTYLFVRNNKNAGINKVLKNK